MSTTSLTISPSQRANLTKLAEHLEQLPAGYGQFGMSHYYRLFPVGCAAERVAERTSYLLHNGGVPCGTVACALGHGPAAGVLFPAKLVFDGGYPLWDSYAELFIPAELDDCWDWCFSCDWSGVDNTPAGAAARIRYLLDHGEPLEQFSQHDDDSYAASLPAYQPYLKEPAR